jgi:predicted ABC-type ATPase
VKRAKRPPSLQNLLRPALAAGTQKPVAFVVAGHNGSGKSTLWYERLVEELRIPLINADRLTMSILPPPNQHTRMLPDWAQSLRDRDVRWQLLSQEGVITFMNLITEKRMSFAFETVFSHWKKHSSGRIESKADIIRKLQESGYFVVLIFVGLVSAELSILRVATRRAQGGHDVPIGRLRERFPRTQIAIGHAAPIADMAIMFDNSGSPRQAFTLVRAQRGTKVLFDCRDTRYRTNSKVKKYAKLWLSKVVGPFKKTV